MEELYDEVSEYLDTLIKKLRAELKSKSEDELIAIIRQEIQESEEQLED